MNEKAEITRERILMAAQQEFLKEGFRGASLRHIAGKAQVTTGALYGHFAGKEALFDALVGPHAQRIMDMFRQAQDEFASLPAEAQQRQIGSISGDCMEECLDYMYAHKDAFYLLLKCADGTRYVDFVHQMVVIEINATHAFNDTLRGLGVESKLLDPNLEHVLVSGMFSAYFEIIIHDMPLEEAKQYLQELRAFYTAGWRQIMHF